MEPYRGIIAWKGYVRSLFSLKHSICFDSFKKKATIAKFKTVCVVSRPQLAKASINLDGLHWPCWLELLSPAPSGGPHIPHILGKFYSFSFILQIITVVCIANSVSEMFSVVQVQKYCLQKKATQQIINLERELLWTLPNPRNGFKESQKPCIVTIYLNALTLFTLANLITSSYIRQWIHWVVSLLFIFQKCEEGKIVQYLRDV